MFVEFSFPTRIRLLPMGVLRELGRGSCEGTAGAAATAAATVAAPVRRKSRREGPSCAARFLNIDISLTRLIVVGFDNGARTRTQSQRSRTNELLDVGIARYLGISGRTELRRERQLPDPLAGRCENRVGEGRPRDRCPRLAEPPRRLHVAHEVHFDRRCFEI